MSSTGADIRITGHVQGVGFRYFTITRARRLGVTGWVRNERDGSVAVHAEGDRGAIESLIDELKLGPSSASVRDLQVSWTAFSDQYSDFDVSR